MVFIWSCLSALGRHDLKIKFYCFFFFFFQKDTKSSPPSQVNGGSSKPESESIKGKRLKKQLFLKKLISLMFHFLK